MIRISTFGRLALDDESGPVGGAASWRPSLAALALLAASGDHGVPRERLLALIWPESSPERARNSLKQLLSTLRRFLPESALTGTGVLRLERSAISCDLWDFDAALRRGDLEAAIALYAGPFLDGFALPGAIEFERWAESERSRLAGEFNRALETLAERAAASGDHRTAVSLMRRLAAAEPLDSDIALRLMLALVASGNRAGALQHFEVHAALVHNELEVEPDPAIVEYAAALREPRHAAGGGASFGAPSPTRPAPFSAPARPSERRSAPNLRLVVDGAPQQPPASGTSRAEVAAPRVDADAPRVDAPYLHARPRPRRGRALYFGAMLTLGVALAVAGIARIRRDAAARRPAVASVSNPAVRQPVTLAVLPFDVRGGPAVAQLGTGVQELLSASLDGAGPIRTVDSRRLGATLGGRDDAIDAATARALARGVGARYYVTGSVVEAAGRVRIVAQLHGGDASPGARRSVESSADSVFAAVDDLAAMLIAECLRAPAERLSRAASTTTRSLPALKAFLDGELHYRTGRYADAAESYARAIARDSTFALAWYRLAQASDWIGRDDEVLPAAERALRFAGRLAAQDSLLLDAYVHWRHGRLDDAERAYRAVVAEHPDDVEGWFQLGELLFHGNPLRGRSATEARAPLERLLALDPGDAETLVHLARIASSEGRDRAVDSLVRRILALTSGADVLEMRAFRAFALGDRQGQKRVTNALLAAPGSVPALAALQIAVSSDDFDEVERFARLLTEERHADVVRGFGHRLLAQLAVARGRWRHAQRELDDAARYDSTTALELRSLLAVLPFLDVSRPELEQVRDALLRWSPPADESPERVDSRAHLGLHPAIRLYRLGLVSARLGDTAAALVYARELDRESARARGAGIRELAPATFSASVRARVADAAGHPGEALALLERTQWQSLASGFMAEALDRWYRADLLQRVGRADESRGWYRSMSERAAYELVYLAPARLRLADIAAATGAKDRAVPEYRRFIEAWREADPELAPVVERARRELARLAG